MAHLNRNALGLAPFVVFFILVLFAYHELWSGDHHLFYTFRAGSFVPGAADQPTRDGSSAPGPYDNLPSTTTLVHEASPLSASFDGGLGLIVNATAYVQAITHPGDSTFDRLTCPRLESKRYNHLKSNSAKPSYFFALDFRQKVDLLPRLMGSIVEIIRYLGPGQSVLSIVEGHSTDGSFEVLKLLKPELEALGVQYHLVRSAINPSTGDRIGALASLRNLALEPLTISPVSFSPDTTVFFLNDVAVCPEDVLELAHQRRVLGADMVCGMDWVYVGRDPTFYDVWVARTIAGDSFFNITQDGSWDLAWNLFWNAPAEREALQSHKPFQVFSCWNGAAVFSAKPLFEDRIRFRRSREGEGYRKVAVVPSVNLEYDNEHARKIKALKGYTSQWTGEDEGGGIEWVEDPPDKVKCMASYGNQEWRPWDEALPRVE